ncbi:MAG: hypothetical protein KO202_05090 [Methanobacteriaceae archaeon]|jgi:hypothetical protein|nr:hypothetical protein [Methanobacteriaceae archaeon]
MLYKKILFFALLIVITLTCLTTVSAIDFNESVDSEQSENIKSTDLLETHNIENSKTQQETSNLNSENEKNINYIEKNSENNLSDLNNKNNQTANLNNNDSKLNTSIESDNLEMYHSDGSKFVVLLKDSNSNPLSNQIITFTINGKDYDRITNESGHASIAINLNPDSYTIISSFKGNNNNNPSNVTNIINIKNTIFGDDLIKYYLNNKQYIAKFLDFNGEPLININISFNINGVFYTRTTDSEGNARLNINLNPNEYILTTTHPKTDLKHSNKITVLTTIEASDLEKVFLDKNQFVAKILDTEGNPLINKEITMNINGVFYKRTTNPQGEATLNINLNPNTYILTVIHPETNLMRSYTVKVLPQQTISKNSNGYWVFGRDMHNINLQEFKDNGIGNIFLNFYAVTLYGQAGVEEWISQATLYNINVHIWMQVFYEGGWISPVNPDGSYKYNFFNQKINEAVSYANIRGVSGIHLDYLRFPGTASNYPTGTGAINEFTRLFSEKLNSINSNLILSAAVMPETSSNIRYYGQDISQLGKYLDVLTPMIYKGNYNAGSGWISSTTQWFVKNSPNAEIWVGLQGYNSDNDIKPLSKQELFNDASTAINAGASGAVIFRFGVSSIINFKEINNEPIPDTLVSINDVINIAKTLRTLIASNSEIPETININNQNYAKSQVIYLISVAIIKINNGDFSDIPAINVNNAPNPAGDPLNSNINKEEYLDLINRVINFIRNNKQVPNYASSPIGKISSSNFLDTFSRILAFYSENNYLPNRVLLVQ